MIRKAFKFELIPNGAQSRKMKQFCGQQHEPSEVSQQNIVGHSRNPLTLGRGGCQHLYPIIIY